MALLLEGGEQMSSTVLHNSVTTLPRQVDLFRVGLHLMEQISILLYKKRIFMVLVRVTFRKRAYPAC